MNDKTIKPVPKGSPLQDNSLPPEEEPPVNFMTVRGEGVDFDFDQNTIGLLPVGTVVEFVFWYSPPVAVKLGDVTVSPNGVIPLTAIGTNVESSLLEFMPVLNDVLNVQLTLDGTNWIQVTATDIDDNSVMQWIPETCFQIKKLRRI